MVYAQQINIDSNMEWTWILMDWQFTPSQYSIDGRYTYEWQTIMNDVDRKVSLLWYNTTPSWKLRLYSVNVKKESDPYIELVPCYRKSDWVIWMYDLINDVFYTNQGNWVFTKWNNIGGSIENAGVLSVNWNTWNVTVSEFTPSNAWTTDQILTKTVNWYKRWPAPASWITNDTTWTTTTVTKIRAGAEQEYNALATKNANTIYHVY